jgi:hypothetical protein
MLLFRHQNEGQNQDRRRANRSFGNVSQFRYLEMTVTNGNLIQEEIKRRFNSDNVVTIRSGTFCLLVCCRET